MRRHLWLVVPCLTVALAAWLTVYADQPSTGPASAPSGATTSTRPVARFTISKETTYITGPVNPDGTINYVEAYNKLLGKGVTADNNAALLIAKAIGPKAIANLSKEPDRQKILKALGLEDLPETGDYLRDVPFPKDSTYASRQAVYERIDRAQTQPADKLEDAALLRWLNDNEKPLALMQQAAKRPRYFTPWISNQTPPTMLDVLIVLNMPKWLQTGQLFATRAMHAASDGKVEAATEDLMALHRLARLQCQAGTLVDYFIAGWTERTACNTGRAIACNSKLTSKQAAAMLSQLDSLDPFPLLSDATLVGERLHSLDAGMMMTRMGFEGFLRWYEDESSILASTAPGLEKIPLPRFDFDTDAYLRAINKHYDDLTAAMSHASFARCQAAFTQIIRSIPKEVVEVHREMPDTDIKLSGILARERIRLLTKKMGAENGDAFARAFARLDFSGLDEGSHHERVFYMGMVRRADLVQSKLCLALAGYRADKGEFPHKLDDLWPKYLGTVQFDPFTSQPMKYARKGKGYILYSLGPNMKDDGGHKDGATLFHDPKLKDDVVVTCE